MTEKTKRQSRQTQRIILFVGLGCIMVVIILLSDGMKTTVSNPDDGANLEFSPTSPLSSTPSPSPTLQSLRQPDQVAVARFQRTLTAESGTIAAWETLDAGIPQMNCATATQALPRFNQPLVDLVLTQLDEKQIPYERVEAWKYYGSPCVLRIPERYNWQEIIVVLRISSTDTQSADVLDALMEVLAVIA